MHDSTAQQLFSFSNNLRLKMDPILGHGNILQGNMLIQGDNLEALTCLAESHGGTMQCVYIDPPYNTGNAFAHYSDDLAHQAWLDMMAPRLSLMRQMLKPEGYFFVSIDEAQMAYLKVMCDSIFGRSNFIGNLIWEKKKKPSFLSHLATVTEYILVYARDKSVAKPLYHGKTTEGKKYPINNAGNPLRVLTFQPGTVEFTIEDQTIEPMDMSEGRIVTRLLDKVQIVNGRNLEAFRLEGEWRYSQQKLDAVMKAGDTLRISKVPFRPNHIKAGGEPKKMKNLLSISQYGLPTYEDAAAESRAIFGTDAFDYPKPEGLIQTLIEACSKQGDWVLDAFLGSGTTAAVAQKTGRKWIGIEQGSHCISHCQPRLKSVCSNQGSEGGFAFYRLEA